MCHACHILPYSRPDVSHAVKIRMDGPMAQGGSIAYVRDCVLQLYARLLGRSPDLFDESAGLTLSPDLHTFFDHYWFGILPIVS